MFLVIADKALKLYRHYKKKVERYQICIDKVCNKVAKKTNSVAQEPKGSSPHSQQPATSPILSQSNPLQTPQANFPKIHSDPIFPPMPWSSKWSLSFGLSHQDLVLNL
jgi:hypothetical protein